MSTATARAANRPSRRHQLVQAAVELFALQPWDVVTVNDIVDGAGMTSAAFYYHFDSKIQLLEEIVVQAAPAWEAVVTDVLADVQDPADFDDAAAALLAWLEDHAQLATVFLVNAAGASETIDEIVEWTRVTLVHRAAETIARLVPDCSPARRDVAAVGLVNVLELAASARLRLDDVYRALGPRRFVGEVADLMRLIVAVPDD